MSNSFWYRTAGCVSAAAMLGGCQSLWGQHASSVEIRPVQSGQAAASGEIALAQGRAHLLAGDALSAIESFQSALHDSATIPAAHNGLGIAYARLGEEDLAEHYFERAVAGDPDNPRFAANLKRLRDRRELAVTNPSSPTVPLKAVPAREEFEFRSASVHLRVSSPSEKTAVMRLARGEVAIRTSAPSAGDGRRRNPNFQPSRAPSAGSAYPVRVAFSQAPKPTGEAQRKRAAGYPVRIDLRDR